MSFTGPDFPSTVTPTARALTAGDFASSKFRSQNGAEVRVQYGNKRTNTELSLSYDNVTDAQAAAIHDHYHNCRGTVGVFGLLKNNKQGNPGFDDANDSGGTNARFSASPYGLKYRYAEPPQFTSIKPGRMSVAVKLVGVLDV